MLQPVCLIICLIRRCCAAAEEAVGLDAQPQPPDIFRKGASRAMQRRINDFSSNSCAMGLQPSCDATGAAGVCCLSHPISWHPHLFKCWICLGKNERSQ